MDRFHQFFSWCVLKQIAQGAGPQGTVNILLPLVGSEDDEASRRFSLADCYYSINPIHNRHTQIDESHIRAASKKLFDSIPAIASLGDNSHVLWSFNHRYQTFPHPGMIIRNQKRERPCNLHT